jgi:hypothetical protein
VGVVVRGGRWRSIYFAAGAFFFNSSISQSLTGPIAALIEAARSRMLPEQKYNRRETRELG